MATQAVQPCHANLSRRQLWQRVGHAIPGLPKLEPVGLVHQDLIPFSNMAVAFPTRLIRKRRNQLYHRTPKHSTCGKKKKLPHQLAGVEILPRPAGLPLSLYLWWRHYVQTHRADAAHRRRSSDPATGPSVVAEHWPSTCQSYLYTAHRHVEEIPLPGFVAQWHLAVPTSPHRAYTLS